MVVPKKLAALGVKNLSLPLDYLEVSQWIVLMLEAEMTSSEIRETLNEIRGEYWGLGYEVNQEKHWQSQRLEVDADYDDDARNLMNELDSAIHDIDSHARYVGNTEGVENAEKAKIWMLDNAVWNLGVAKDGARRQRAERSKRRTVTPPACGSCGKEGRLIPAGTSRAGRPYAAFWGCSQYRSGCKGNFKNVPVPTPPAPYRDFKSYISSWKIIVNQMDKLVLELTDESREELQEWWRPAHDRFSFARPRAWHTDDSGNINPIGWH